MKRVEDADLNVGVRGQSADAVVLAMAGGVIQQQPHAHAAVGGLQHFVDQRTCGEAVMDDVVLDIEADLRRADHLGACGEGFGALR